MRIRLAHPEDIAAARAVESKAFSSNRGVYRPNRTARAIHTDPDVVRLVAEIEGTIVGTTCYWMENEMCHLGNVAVDANYRGGGIARGMVDEVEATCRRQGIGCISAKTIRQAGQVPFYQRLGFVIVNEWTPTWAESATGEPITEVELHKRLSGNSNP